MHFLPPGTGSINGQLTTIIRPQADTLITPRADGSAGGPLLSQRQFRRPRSLLDKDLPSLEFERGVFAPLASEAGALLDYAALKLKMTGVRGCQLSSGYQIACIYYSYQSFVKVARECELYGPVGDACLLLIHEAVEHYLKNIIGDCITRCRPKTVGNAKSAIGRESATGRESAMAVAATSSSTDNGAVSTTSTITLRDLYFSMKLTGPRLADHGWSLAMERMAAGSMLENLEQGV